MEFQSICTNLIFILHIALFDCYSIGANRAGFPLGPSIQSYSRRKNMGKYAVITGASSGIGAAFAELLAARGYSLIITGRRRERIEAVAERIRSQWATEVQVMIVELTTEDQKQKLIREISSRDDIELLINNAGFGLSHSFVSDDTSEHYKMLDVHMRIPLELIEAVLPSMVRRSSGGIINVASVAAFFPMPKASTYSASKAFLVSFSESLAMEVAAAGIDVQALCPGLTRTDFHEKMGASGKEIAQRNLFGWMDPYEVCNRSLKKLQSDRVIFVPGVINKFLVGVVSHTPRWLYYPLVRAAREKA